STGAGARPQALRPSPGGDRDPAASDVSTALTLILEHWRSVLLALWIVVGIGAAGHALLTRRDPRAAWGWIAVCWLFPFAGPALYFLFGIDRMRTRARRVGMESRLPVAIGPD